jgi:hypothetical protein
MEQSQNFFAALDDSGDEAPPKAPAAKTTAPPPASSATKGTSVSKPKNTGGKGGDVGVDPSQPDPR